jgi:hypothetical protein
MVTDDEHASVVGCLSCLFSCGVATVQSCRQADHGSFGWDLAVKRDILWPCMGPAFGLHPGSFQAESCSMLSALLFLALCLRFFQVQVSDNVEYFFCCNNQGHIKRIGFAIGTTLTTV